jgi:hypothetical protein
MIKTILTYLHSAGLLLLITAIAKLISACGSAPILQNPDPILLISFRNVFCVVGGVELLVALMCFFIKNVGWRAGFVACLATSFLIYRLGLLWIGYHRPCSCLGNLTGAIHIPPQIADTVMKIILVYLLIGSYAILFWLWGQRRKIVSSSVGVASL